jgi:hypothetical protein
MLLVCFSIFIKSLLKYNFFLSDTYHPDTLYPIYVSKNVGIRRYFSKPKGAREKILVNTSGVPTIGADATATRSKAFPWCHSNCNGLNKTFNDESRGLPWHRRPTFSQNYREAILVQGRRNYATRHLLVYQIFLFLSQISASILWRICVYINISDCLETVYEVLLLPSNTASESFDTNREPCEGLARNLSVRCRPCDDWANT